MAQGVDEQSKLRKQLASIKLVSSGKFTLTSPKHADGKLPHLDQPLSSSSISSKDALCRRGSKDSVLVTGASAHLRNPVLDDPDRTTGQMDRLLDKVKRVKVDRASRHAGLTNGRYPVAEPEVKVLESVKDWVHVQHVKTGETWFYNKDTQRIEFKRPLELCSAQEIADRERTILILKNISPEDRTQAQLESLGRMLKDCATLQQFGAETLKETCRTMRYQKTDAKESIMWQGDDADNFYFLIRGNVGVWITPPNAPPLKKEICETGGPVNQIKVVVLGEGKGFGEQGLMYDEKRNASIVTEGPCEFGVIEKKYFCEVLKAHFVKAAKARCLFLEGHLPVILGEQRIRSFENVEGFFKETPALKGQMLSETGKKNDTLDIIYEGTCKVYWQSRSAKGADVSKFTICELGAGQILNIRSIIAERPEEYDVVVSSEKCKVLRMQKADCMSRLPSLMHELLVESEQTRLGRYVELAKRLEVCFAVENLSSHLTAQADVRRKSLEDQLEDWRKYSSSKSAPYAAGLSPAECEMQLQKLEMHHDLPDELPSDDDGSSSGFNSAAPSRRGSTAQVFEGLQKELRSLRRNSCGPRANGANALSSFGMSILSEKLSPRHRNHSLLQPSLPSAPRPQTTDGRARPRRGSSHL